MGVRHPSPTTFISRLGTILKILEDGYGQNRQFNSRATKNRK